MAGASGNPEPLSQQNPRPVRPEEVARHAGIGETILLPTSERGGAATPPDALHPPVAPATPVPPDRTVTIAPSKPATPEEAGATKIGRYTLQGVLGKGGFGKVYLAYDETLRRKVAIKAPRLDLSKAEVEQEFLTEARQLAQLKHPGIVGVLDVVSDHRSCYIISDFVAGVTLSEWMVKNQPDWRMSAQICALIADALAHAHAHRTVHRDLKFANVIMTPDNQPVIVDFGLAVSDNQRAEGTSRGEISGTPGYMSPEQAAGAGHRIDGRTDIYSLGVILYRMLTGRMPFESPNTAELLRQIIEDEPQPPRQLNRTLPPDLERVCLKAMAKSVRERYTTADDFASDLRQVLSGGATSIAQAARSGTSGSGAPPLADAREPAHETPPVGQPLTSVLGDSVTGAAGQLAKTPAQRFGEPLSALESSRGMHSSSTSTSRRRQVAQRRRVTIVGCGCDVFENESIQELLDSDEQSEVLLAFQKFCRQVGAEFRGTVLQDTDDGVAVCFGFPRAFEDSVSCAVRFGLELLARLPEFNQAWQAKKFQLAARVVIHTDVAVVESQDAGEEASSISVVGTIRNFTSRLEQAAELGCVIVSEQTHNLVRGYFESQALGEQRIKGLPGLVTLYRIERERTGAARVDLVQSALTPLIGRDREVGLLQDRWEQAAEGMGQVVLIIGEAGLGKSRLVHSLKRHVVETASGDGDPIIEWRSSQQRQNSSLYPAIECFERLLGFERGETPEKQLDKLVGYLGSFGLDGNKDIALVASLLSIPLQGRYPELDLSPQTQREELTQLLFEWLRQLSLRHPTLFVIEDLHWMDPSTLEFVELLVDQGLNDRILTLLTFRPEFETPWKSKAHQTSLALTRLTKRQIQEMMEQKAKRKLSSALVEQVIERTDGVPLFVEEYTQMIVESDAFSSESGASVSGIRAAKQIPSSLQDMLMSRLDRIDCDIGVVQLAATIGRNFSFELIRASTTMPEAELQQELDKLVAAELLFAQGRAPRVSYQFKHALLQDAAYNSVVKAKRQEFHGRIGEALESQFASDCEKEPEVVAQHFTEAGVPEKAADYWGRAGQRSLQRYAYREAIQQFRAGLDALRLLPETRGRQLREIQMHIGLGVPLQSIVGYSAPEVEENYARAFALCQELKLTTELFPILYGLFRYYMLQAKYAKAREIGGQLVALAEQAGEPDYVVAAHRAVAGPLVYQGEYAAALPHLDRVLSIPATSALRAKVYRYDVVDPWIAAGSYKAWTLWLIGRPQQALEQCNKTLAEAESLKHPFTIALALSFSTWLHQFRRDVPATLKAAERALALSEEHGFRFWTGWGNVLKFWSLGITGRDANAGESIRQGIVAWRAQGSELGSSYFYGLQAEVALSQNRLTDATAALSQAHDFAKATGEGFPLPELHRLRGEVAARLNDAAAAETHFRAAIEIAQRQGSRSHELRCIVSLARLLRARQHFAEASEMLAVILTQFQEGQDTADVQEALELQRNQP